ncbi:phage portal protein [Aquincola sp. S2]|uniref:Phage portal protein n=1 Tax=Pseudaquabacterium terrae TaxID=2732868 RepID=A0ABX2ENY1_9BURK|nr:phage portal protein [Aquabacterium terrae]NRF70362.1 phage portal protein [Aquabacterium terrae]
MKGRFRDAKAVADFMARYDAGGTGRRVKSWQPPSSGPRDALQPGFERLRNRGRDVARNDWAGESGVQKWTTTLIGTGIQPRWADPTVNEAWERQGRTCDADGVSDVYGMQALGVRSWIGSGEVFLRLRVRNDSLVARGFLASPVQYQLIESDFCPMFDADQWDGMPKDHYIRQGIELNRYGRRVAYWMYPEHPGDRSRGISPGKHDLIRIRAEEISHVFEPLRPGQLRGVSPLAPILVRLRNAADFEDATLDRQKLGNLFVAFLKRNIPAGAHLEYDPVTGLPVFYNQKGDPLAGLEPGMFQELMPGEEMQFANPPDPAASYPDFMRVTNRGTAAGLGLPYELFAGDIQDVSDRTLRVIINEFRRYAEQRIWTIVIPKLCQPMVDWWAIYGAGNIAHSVASRPTWHPQGWPYIHPVQDVEGKVKAIEAGLTSRSAVISERGDDPRGVARQIAEDAELFPVAPPTVAPAVASMPDDLRRFEARAADQQIAMVNILANLVPAITGKADAASLTRAIDAIKVTAEAAKAAAEKAIDVNVLMPDRKRETNVEYDAASGEIVKSTTIETSLLQ